MPSPERPSRHVPETAPQAYDATALHGDLINLLSDKGESDSLADAHYYTFQIDDHEHPVAVVSNYLTRLVHKSYAQNPASNLDATQVQSLQNNNAVIDIEFPHADIKATYGCFRPADIRPERAYWLNLSPSELAELPQDHYVLFGPDGLVDVETDHVIQFLADWAAKEAEAA